MRPLPRRTARQPISSTTSTREAPHVDGPGSNVSREAGRPTVLLPAPSLSAQANGAHWPHALSPCAPPGSLPVQAKDGENRCIDASPFFGDQMPCDVSQNADIDCAPLLYENPGCGAIDSEFGVKDAGLALVDGGRPAPARFHRGSPLCADARHGPARSSERLRGSTRPQFLHQEVGRRRLFRMNQKDPQLRSPLSAPTSKTSVPWGPRLAPAGKLHASRTSRRPGTHHPVGECWRRPASGEKAGFSVACDLVRSGWDGIPVSI
jgi:hypothetical protein